MEISLEEMGARLKTLAGQVAEELDNSNRLAVSVDDFTGQLGSICDELAGKIESLTMAKAGLEALLSGYKARYGSRADEVEEVGQFRALLAEKIRLLEEAGTDLSRRGAEVRQVMDQLNLLDLRTGDGLADLESIIFALKAARLAEQNRIAQGKDRVQSLAHRFWPDLQPGAKTPAPLPARRRLDQAGLSRVVDRALIDSVPDSSQRQEVLAQLVQSVRDESIRAALAAQLAES